MQHDIAPLAMAGPAEAAESIALMIAWGGLLVAAIAACITFSTRSRMAAVISAVISAFAAVAVTILFGPWVAFSAAGVEAVEDPDVAHWIGAWRLMAGAWIVVLVLAAGAVVKVRRLQRAAK